MKWTTWMWTNVLLIGQLLAAPARAGEPAAAPGFLVAAPDRGFQGNEEIRDAFDAFAKGRNAALVYVTDERTRTGLESAVSDLAKAGARRVVILPLFLARSEPRFQRLESLVRAMRPKAPVTWARPFGESYFAVEALAARLRAIGDPAGRRVVVVGSGAAASDMQRIVDAASAGLGFEAARAAVPASHQDVRASLAEAASGATRPVIVPFHLGRKLDSMMSFTASVRHAAPDGAEVVDTDLTPDETVALWMAREANRQFPATPEDTGVVVLAHGADYHWNDTMWKAALPLSARYKLEPAFTMADPPVIERAVRRLEARGARRIVILRVFGLADSFRPEVERLTGLDIEGGDPHAAHAMHHGHGHGHGPSRPSPRILSSAVLSTVGGLEDHPLFAEALLDRARAVSNDPAKETLILVAHGAADDQQDAHWNRLLASLADKMRAKGARFRAIHGATWREDWPEKRKAAVERVRSLVEEASRDGGRALVVPARTLGQGPERRLLEGLTFELGEGFAPHPLFARWAEERVQEAFTHLAVQAAPPNAALASSVH